MTLLNFFSLRMRSTWFRTPLFLIPWTSHGRTDSLSVKVASHGVTSDGAMPVAMSQALNPFNHEGIGSDNGGAMSHSRNAAWGQFVRKRDVVV